MIAYRHSPAGIEPNDLHGFFVGWPNPPSPATHLRILRSSAHVILAVEEPGTRVVGFITAVSDGILSAYIPLLEVLPSHQGNGIGSELVRRMVGALEQLYMVDLQCDPELQRFYERLGFVKARGMTRRNYQRQSGA